MQSGIQLNKSNLDLRRFLTELNLDPAELKALPKNEMTAQVSQALKAKGIIAAHQDSILAVVNQRLDNLESYEAAQAAREMAQYM